MHLSMFDVFRLYTFKKMGFPCKLCSKIYSDSSSYKRHVNSVHLNEKFKCAKCEYQTNRKDVLSKHIMRKHESNKRKPETQIESDNKKMKLQDNNDCNDDWRFFENWLNTDHNDQEYEIDMEDVEKFVNNIDNMDIDIDIDELKTNNMEKGLKYCNMMDLHVHNAINNSRNFII